MTASAEEPAPTKPAHTLTEARNQLSNAINRYEELSKKRDAMITGIRDLLAQTRATMLVLVPIRDWGGETGKVAGRLYNDLDSLSKRICAAGLLTLNPTNPEHRKAVAPDYDANDTLAMLTEAVLDIQHWLALEELKK